MSIRLSDTDKGTHKSDRDSSKGGRAITELKPCPLCGCKCATECKDMDYYYNGKEMYQITTRCVCGISFESAYSFEITEDRTERLKVRADALIDHLKKWNNRTVYKDMMDICAYAENIKTRTQKYSKIKEEQ